MDDNPALADVSGSFVPIFCTMGFSRESRPSISHSSFMLSLWQLVCLKPFCGWEGNVLEMQPNYKQLMTTGLWSCFLNWLGLWLWRWVAFVSASAWNNFCVTASSLQGMSSPGKAVTMLKTAHSCCWWWAGMVSHRHLPLNSAGSTEGEQP